VAPAVDREPDFAEIGAIARMKFWKRAMWDAELTQVAGRALVMLLWRRGRHRWRRAMAVRCRTNERRHEAPETSELHELARLLLNLFEAAQTASRWTQNGRLHSGRLMTSDGG
jgi:hypothetical protein